MVYNDWKNLGWEPYVQSWLARRKEKRLIEPLKALFEKYMTNFAAKTAKSSYLLVN